MLAPVWFHVREKPQNFHGITGMLFCLYTRRLYYGDEYHEIALQEIYRCFTLVWKIIKKVRKAVIDKSQG